MKAEYPQKKCVYGYVINIFIIVFSPFIVLQTDNSLQSKINGEEIGDHDIFYHIFRFSCRNQEISLHHLMLEDLVVVNMFFRKNISYN